MDDLAYGIKYPAVIDFKMGRQTYDPEESIEKINRLNSKYPLLEKTGFQLIGMRVNISLYDFKQFNNLFNCKVFNNKEKNFQHFDKKFGRSLDEENLLNGKTLKYRKSLINKPMFICTTWLN